jgi:hypothetical protein
VLEDDTEPLPLYHEHPIRDVIMHQALRDEGRRVRSLEGHGTSLEGRWIGRKGVHLQKRVPKCSSSLTRQRTERRVKSEETSEQDPRLSTKRQNPSEQIPPRFWAKE